MERLLTCAEAIREATEQEMARDPRVLVLGQGVDDFRGIYGTTKGLAQTFGADRVFDTPLAEDGMTGVAIGAALAGMRPIHVHIRMDFLLLCMNQLINIAAKSSYMFGGSLHVPLVVRSVIGRSWGQGAQHSQGLHALFMHIPGLKVVAPSTPYDAKGLLIEAIRDDNPVIFVEHRMVHALKGHVPEESYTVPFGRARILEEGDDITLVGISHMVVECLRAARCLTQIGLRAEVIDPVSLSPLDAETIVKSVRKTGKLLVVDTGWTSCGAGAEIVTQVAERLQGVQDFRFARMGYQPVPCPTTPVLEELFYPNPQTIAATAARLVRGEAHDWMPEKIEAPELVQFKGPF
ncbi:MAG TPA: transketolase C-terminal domain-containing protein [Chthonomonas sp.]|uniref:alpha-ketoacid dehydrogenase subunit beta n=1 Tax=Chthonomonas sp. TaxID=2282153 RepID=UPI002B4B20A1|nr:transketolase C-terminal domain-containing protein [Chthonomonas sp.]HLI47203.1 transketolase C-terminal domain-containing protein [Chthonomonas sp.]